MRLIEDGTYIVDVSEVDLDKIKRVMLVMGNYCTMMYPDEPEPKKGNWIGVDDEPCDVYECDRCGTTYDTVDSTWDLPNYCPNCGADMRGKEE